MSRPRKLRSDHDAGRFLAREIAMSQRWALIARHSLLTSGKGRVLFCGYGAAEQKAAYPSRRAAEAARADLEAVGAHTHHTEAYECTARLPGRKATHWHLTSRLHHGQAR